MTAKQTKKTKPALKGSLRKLAQGGAQLAQERDEQVNKDQNASDTSAIGQGAGAELGNVGQNKAAEPVSSENEVTTDRKTSKRVKKGRAFEGIFIKDAQMIEEKNRSTALASSNYKALEMLAKAGGTSIIAILNNIVKDWREDNMGDIKIWKQKYIDDL